MCGAGSAQGQVVHVHKVKMAGGTRLGMLVVMKVEGRNTSGHSRFHYKKKGHPNRVLT